jgi:hypothetical protein
MTGCSDPALTDDVQTCKAFVQSHMQVPTMNTCMRTLLSVAAMAVVATSALAQRHMNSDWTWNDTSQWHRDLTLSTSQGSRISTINRRATAEIRRINGLNIGGQERALRIRAVRDRARQDILMILSSRQRTVLQNRGFDVLMNPYSRTSTYTLRKVKMKGKHGGGKG